MDDEPPSVTCRKRVLTSLAHCEPDRVPCDLLAVPEVWEKLQQVLQVGCRHDVLRKLEVDCRRISYDSYCAPPEDVVAGGTIEWYRNPARSTTERTWRLRTSDGLWKDIWGASRREVQHAYGRYEELASFPLAQATSLADLATYRWPTPGWFDFSRLPMDLASLDAGGQCHIRYRIGNLFGTTWALRGFEQTLMDLMLAPELPCYIMDRILGIHIANLRTVLDMAGERIDMVYFFDDLASTDGLLMSPETWRQTIKPRQARLLEVAREYGKQAMYHCDGSIYLLIPELIDMGVTLLNPIQPDAKDMDPERLKNEFGDRLSFHGGVDIVNLLPRGQPDEIRKEAQRLVRILGQGGGYILAASHHIQADTPVENILAMYETELRLA